MMRPSERISTQIPSISTKLKIQIKGQAKTKDQRPNFFLNFCLGQNRAHLKNQIIGGSEDRNNSVKNKPIVPMNMDQSHCVSWCTP